MSFREALRSYLAGLALAVLTPMAAGEAGRGLFVRSETTSPGPFDKLTATSPATSTRGGTRGGRAGSSEAGGSGGLAGLTGKVILDKLVDLSTVGMFAGTGLLLAEEPAARTVGLIIFVGTVVTWSGMLLSLPKLEELAAGVEAGWLVRSFGGLGTRFRIPAIVSGLTRTPVAQLALNMGLSLVGFTVFYSQAFVLMRAFWAEAPWAVVPYFPIITLSTIVPIGIGGVGVREWTAVLLLRRFGVTESVAISAFFTHFVVVQLLPALAGAAIIATTGAPLREYSRGRRGGGSDVGSTATSPATSTRGGTRGGGEATDEEVGHDTER